MKVLITGAGGQLGTALRANPPEGVTINCYASSQLDIRDREAVLAAAAADMPRIIINAAAFTKVDEAETKPDLANAINNEGVANLAHAANECGARLIHISTDFVFDGRASTPYSPEDTTSPLSVYGRTKRAGEIAAGPDALIVRTGWVYGPRGRNFVSTMLRLMREREELRVVDDQIGTPTSTSSLAEAIWSLAAADVRGLWHFSDSGVASWYDFAVAIMEESMAMGILSREISIAPIATDEYPTPARRPRFSVLDKRKTFAALGKDAPHWRSKLRQTLEATESDE